MLPTLFVSDLHLDAAWPEITELFLGFLADEAREAATKAAAEAAAEKKEGEE